MDLSANEVNDRVPFSHLQRVVNATTMIGGLSFNAPVLLGEQCEFEVVSVPMDVTASTSPVLRDIGKIVTAKMGQTPRAPVTIGHYENPRLHSTLARNLGTGIMDMWCKQEDSTTIVLPKKLEAIIPLLKPMVQFEANTNPNFHTWNMWLLVDTRPVLAGHTQRNAGYHYDGLNLGGKYAGTPLVSIYAWCNRLPTLFYTGGITFPSDFDGTRDNASILAQKQIKDPRKILIPSVNSIIKFDGATPHAGANAEYNIPDRVFVRVCFTPPSVWFDREGNTKNPCLQYPKLFQWRRVPDPSVWLRNTVDFTSPGEFKNLWDIACLGHHAFATMYEGKNAHEYQLMQQLRKMKGPEFVKEVMKLYNTSEVDQNRARLLLLKYES